MGDMDGYGWMAYVYPCLPYTVDYQASVDDRLSVVEAPPYGR